MLRTELLEKLELVAPALSKSKLVPLLQNFWFMNDRLIAYNDQVAISTDLDSGLRLAVPPTLVDLLDASKAKEVELSLSQRGELLVKAASSRFKLPYDIIKDGIFEMPELGNGLPVKSEDLTHSIQMCLLSLGEDPALPDSMGVTMIAEGDNLLHLFATDNATISYSKVKLLKEVQPFKGVVSASFCKQILKMAKLEGHKHFEVAKDYALFVCGKNILFGRLVLVKRPLDFGSIIDSTVTKERRKQMISVPSKLHLILDRAIAISSKAQSVTEITIENGKADFFTKSDHGEVRDHMQLEEPHPDVWVKIDPRLFKNGYGDLEKMLLTETALIMANDSDIYLVSASV